MYSFPFPSFLHHIYHFTNNPRFSYFLSGTGSNCLFCSFSRSFSRNSVFNSRSEKNFFGRRVVDGTICLIVSWTLHPSTHSRTVSTNTGMTWALKVMPYSRCDNYQKLPKSTEKTLTLS